MKKLYRKGKVHPSPPYISDHLSSLPAAILTLTAALSLDDKQVLAYLISCSAAPTYNPKHAGVSTSASGGDHPPTFNCDCFRCYTSYWVRWDASPNRQLIHEIIDAYEDGLFKEKKKKKRSKGEKTKRADGKSKNRAAYAAQELNGDGGFGGERKSGEPEPMESGCDGGAIGTVGDGGEVGGGEGVKGTVRRLVNFIGERFWGVWSK